LKIKKYAAIDIGSNAIRLLIANVIIEKNTDPRYKKVSLVRVPIRLGKDVFTSGSISEKSQKRMVDAMNAYRLLMNVHQTERYKACATSAMRESSNGQNVVALIKRETGIDIDIIDGEMEAAIISSTDLGDLIDGRKSYLYVDVGGGSTEFTFYSYGKVVASQSYKMGSVRLLDKEKNKETWSSIEKWIKTYSKGLGKVEMIGSGGNINTIFKHSGKKFGKPLSYSYLKGYNKLLKKMSYEERISELALNPDRADVIIPAMHIYLSAMKWSGAQKAHVPKIGLADGIIKSLHLGKFD